MSGDGFNLPFTRCHKKFIKGIALPEGAIYTAAIDALRRARSFAAWRCGCIAQLVEQLTLNQPVLGSNPRAPTIFSLLVSRMYEPA